MNGILKALSSLTSSGAGLLVVCLFAGALAAACASSFVNAAVGSAVRAMISHGANAEEKALGLDELGVGKNIFVRAALKRRRGLLSRLVGRVERDGAAAYWLPESSREKAEAIYGGKKQIVLRDGEIWHSRPHVCQRQSIELLVIGRNPNELDPGFLAELPDILG